MSETIATDREPVDQLDESKGGAQATPAKDDQQATPPGRRKRLIALLGAVTLIAGAAYGAYYFTEGRFYESTDDAYVSGNLVQLTPQVTGTVVAVDTDDTQIVKQGDPVVTLDPADARIALADAEASLGQTVRRVSGLYVNNDFYAANVAQRESDLARANDDLRRRTAVADSGAVSAEDIAHARDAVQAAQAALDAARQQGAANHALTDRTSVEQHPDVQAAASKVRAAWLAYARDTLPAPVTGYVAQRQVQVGERVAPGTPLMAIVPLDGVWVDANFKEDQLKKMHAGDRADVTLDAASGTLHGTVESLAPATGATFSVLPPENATGNFTKIVQRVPVRIRVDANAPADLQAALRPGLSATVKVHLTQAH
ncbi:HlyD family efflux transporter periplasmic adaptor subunit [Paraburkholderia sp. BR14261]